MSGLDYSGERMPAYFDTDATATPQVFEFELPWARPPLTENQRYKHWSVKARTIRTVRGTGRILAARVPHFDRVRVELEWVVTTRHKRDVENVVPTLKALCDGLVDADVVDDDTPAYMDKPMPSIRYEPGGRARMVLRITPIPATPKEPTAS